MLNITNNYKLIDLIIDNKEVTVEIDTKEAWNVMKFAFGEEIVVVNEGDSVEFVVNSGVIRKGSLMKITGKGEKTELQIRPYDSEAKETWSVMSIDTLKVITEDNE